MGRQLFASLSVLVGSVSAHMPAFAGSTTREAPMDLGDITKNSWALSGTLSPGEVQHYKFTIESATTAASSEKERFYMGLYVPGAGEDDFRFYVAIFGLPAGTECDRWGDGWGRRRLEQPPRGRALAHPILAVHRYTSDGTTWLAASDTVLPSTVVGAGDENLPVDYNDTSSRLIFIADPAGDLPNKFEPFSPTLFRPRGSCITDFPRGGEYRIAVWSDDTQTAPRKFSVGLGLAERDVFAPQNLVFFDFTLLRIQEWNGWAPAVLLLPIILAVLLLLVVLLAVKKRAPEHFMTSSGWPTPFRWCAAVGGAILIGHVIANAAVLVWAMTNAHAEEFVFPLVTQIVLPLTTGLSTLLIGLRVPCCCCCCPGKPAAREHCGHRAALSLCGLLHVMLHAGYLVGPLLLIVGAVLPPAMADAGLKAHSVTPASKGSGKAPPKTDPAYVSQAVDTTPSTEAVVPQAPKFSNL